MARRFAISNLSAPPRHSSNQAHADSQESFSWQAGDMLRHIRADTPLKESPLECHEPRMLKERESLVFCAEAGATAAHTHVQHSLVLTDATAATVFTPAAQPNSCAQFLLFSQRGSSDVAIFIKNRTTPQNLSIFSQPFLCFPKGYGAPCATCGFLPYLLSKQSICTSHIVLSLSLVLSCSFSLALDLDFSLACSLSCSLARSLLLSFSLSLSLSDSHTHMLGARNKKTLYAAQSSTLTTSRNRTRHDEACMEGTMLHGMHLLFFGGRNYWCTHQ